MLQINFINNTINRQEDTQFLNSRYKRLNRIFNKFDVKKNKKVSSYITVATSIPVIHRFIQLKCLHSYSRVGFVLIIPMKI